ncbi:MAG TPA: DUF167 domain-containing protein [Acidobacteriaceae bacterium]|nr:DUF167 domain-containing protein [Acidobacteriaceae bacterium]
MSLPIDIRDSSLGATFPVRVHPRAGRTAITGTIDGALKLALSAPPTEGRANEALAEFFSGLFRVPRSAVQIVTGGRSRTKIIRIAGQTASSLSLALRSHFTV